MNSQLSIFKHSVVQDILFVLADLIAIKWLITLFQSNRGDWLLIVECLVFYFYGISVYLIFRWSPFVKAHQEAGGNQVGLLFWLKISHIFAFLYIPIGLFLAYLSDSGVYKGNEIVLLVILFALLFIPIIIGRAMGQSGRESKKDFSLPLLLLMNLGFVLAFAFMEVAFREVGDYLLGELTRMITKDFISITIQPPWYLILIYRILFLWFIYLPMRLWLFIPQRKSLAAKISFGASILIILLWGLF